MTKVKIIYEPDENSGRYPSKTNVNRSLLDGKIICIKRSVPEDYKNLRKESTGANRMQVNTNIPKSLTPKGISKMQQQIDKNNQLYDNTIKKFQGTGKLFEDPDFPAESISIGNIPNLPKIEWKRPREINSKAEFFVGGFDRSDVEQGMLGDCWLLAVISSLATYPSLFNHVVPQGQAINTPKYTGIFRFKFWRFGQWIDVVVDDRLPVKAGTNTMIFMHSSQAEEMWSALMEKAYAKLNGSYANLSGGSQSEAMEDLTGGLCESIDLTKQNAENLLKDLQKYEKRCCLMGCSVSSKEIEAKLDNGLIAGHAYSVTGLQPVTYHRKVQWLIRCRNPWGNDYEWKGDWSDNSKLWNDVSSEDKLRLNLSFGGDGEFWMSVEDFKISFTKLEVCHLGLGSLDSDSNVRGKRRLHEVLFTGEWTKGVNAGGCLNNKETFWTNPQFRINVEDPDPDDNDDLCLITIGLMQKDARAKSGGNFMTVGFVVYQINSTQEGILKRGFFSVSKPTAVSEFVNAREVVLRTKIKPGHYVIVPSTFKSNDEGHFLIRVFTEVAIKDTEIDDTNNMRGISDELKRELKENDRASNEDALMDKLFKEYAGKKEAIVSSQLQIILSKSSLKKMTSDGKGFNLELVRSMLAAMDNNQTSLMEYDEFKELWECCQIWQLIFSKRDVDKSKSFNTYEFREALDDAGFKVTNSLFTILVQRYANTTNNTISFDDFILCMVRLKNAFENANAQPKTLDNNLIFTLEDYLRMALYI